MKALSPTSSGPLAVIICGLCGLDPLAVCEEVVAQPPPTSAIASKTIIAPRELNRFADIILAVTGIFAPQPFSVNSLHHSKTPLLQHSNSTL
jgi:hypothetical protein